MKKLLKMIINSKITLITMFFLFISVQSAQNSSLPSVTYLREVIIEDISIERELFNVLVNGKKDVEVRDRHGVYRIDINGVDSSFARLIVAQAKFESGNFLSPLTVEHNNYYGIQYMGKYHKTTALCGCARAENRDGYASYNSAEESALDLLLILQRYKIKKHPKSTYQYALILKSKHYYEAPLMVYANGLQRHYNQRKI